MGEIGEVPCTLGYNGDYDACGVCFGGNTDECPGDTENCPPGQELVDGVCYNMYDFNNDGFFNFNDLVYQMDYINYINADTTHFGTDENELDNPNVPDITGDGSLNIIDVVKMLRGMKDWGGSN